MKKKIDASLVASSLRGESVFSPMRDGKPAPEQAGEPLEQHQSALAPKHQITKAQELQSAKAPNNQQTKDIKQESTKAQENQNTEARSSHSVKALKQQEIKHLKHFSSYLTHESWKRMKMLATEREQHDYEILQNAVDLYFASLDKTHK